MNDDLLLISLEAAVPFWVMKWRVRPESERVARASQCAEIIGSKGDVLQYGGKGCAEAFNALAEGLAILSFFPGGVKFAGHHWETR